jgi:hypothetical protein
MKCTKSEDGKSNGRFVMMLEEVVGAEQNNHFVPRFDTSSSISNLNTINRKGSRTLRLCASLTSGASKDSITDGRVAHAHEQKERIPAAIHEYNAKNGENSQDRNENYMPDESRQ